MGKERTDRLKNNQPSKKPYWPDLPLPLIKAIVTQPLLMCSIHSIGVTKRWMHCNTKCKLSSFSTKAPWLELVDNPIGQRSFTRYNPFLSKFYLRPGLGWSDDVRGVLSSPVEFFCFKHNYYENNGFVYVWRGNEQWEETKLESIEVDPNCSNPSEPDHLMRVTNGIELHGTIYVITLQGTLGVIEKINNTVKITRYSRKRIVPSLGCKFFREYMIESEGRVLVVFLLSFKSFNKIDEVEIYHLKCQPLTLKKVENLGKRSLILGSNCTLSVLANEVGCFENNVLFSLGNGFWWEYDLSTTKICPSKYGGSLLALPFYDPWRN